MAIPVTEARAQARARLQQVALAAGSVLPFALATWMVVSEYTHASGFGRDDAARSQIAFEEATGVRLVYIAVVGVGGMLDLRYQVLDPDKALIVHDDDTPPTILDEDTGIALSRQRHEHGHQEQMRMAGVYYSQLMNSDGIVKRGDQVTLAIGDARLEHVTVY